MKVPDKELREQGGRRGADPVRPEDPLQTKPAGQEGPCRHRRGLESAGAWRAPTEGCVRPPDPNSRCLQQAGPTRSAARQIRPQQACKFLGRSRPLPQLPCRHAPGRRPSTRTRTQQRGSGAVWHGAVWPGRRPSTRTRTQRRGFGVVWYRAFWAALSLPSAPPNTDPPRPDARCQQDSQQNLPEGSHSCIRGRWG